MSRKKKGTSFVPKGNCGFPDIGEEEKTKEKDGSSDGPDFSEFKNTSRANGAWDSTD